MMKRKKLNVSFSNDDETKDKIDSIAVVSSFSLNVKEGCSCKKTYSENSTNLDAMIQSILQANAMTGKKARVKIETEIDT